MKSRHSNAAPRAETHIHVKTLYSMRSLSETTDIKKTKLYELMAKGDLKYIYVASRRYVTADALADFVRSRQAKKSDGSPTVG
jgi:hypothetical protein